MAVQFEQPAPLLSPVWMILLAVVLSLGMLAAFHEVVKDAVHQAELRHQANALVVEAIWRCNSTRPSAASSCARQPALDQMPVRYAVAQQPR